MTELDEWSRVLRRGKRCRIVEVFEHKGRRVVGNDGKKGRCSTGRPDDGRNLKWIVYCWQGSFT